jgi:hypothetical protein
MILGSGVPSGWAVYIDHGIPKILTHLIRTNKTSNLFSCHAISINYNATCIIVLAWHTEVRILGTSAPPILQ